MYLSGFDYDIRIIRNWFGYDILEHWRRLRDYAVGSVRGLFYTSPDNTAKILKRLSKFSSYVLGGLFGLGIHPG